MRSPWLRPWWVVAACCPVSWLCAGCSEADVARASGEYRLDSAATEARSPGAGEVLDDVVLTLNSDGSFSLAGEFAGDARTDKGTWRIAGETITLAFTHVGKREERFERVAAVEGDRLAFETSVQERRVTVVLAKHTFPAWGLSIIAVGMVVFVWLLYARSDSPNVTFEGGSPQFVTLAITAFCVVLCVAGIAGSFKPEVVVWLFEVLDMTSTLGYFGFLALLAIGIIAWAAGGEGGGERVLGAVVGLAIIALLVWLYFRFGIEISADAGQFAVHSLKL